MTTPATAREIVRKYVDPEELTCDWTHRMAEDIAAALDAAVRAERERCARIVEGHAPRTREESQDGTLGTISLVLHAAADALRATEAS